VKLFIYSIVLDHIEGQVQLVNPTGFVIDPIFLESRTVINEGQEKSLLYKEHTSSYHR